MTTREVRSCLIAAGFQWREPGYWSLREGEVELTLEPQIYNAGDFKLGLYRGRVALLQRELLLDVKLRPEQPA